MQSSSFLSHFRQFNRFYANLLARFDSEFYTEELTLTEANVLTELYLSPNITAQEITLRLLMNKGQLSVILKKFERLGYLTKTASQTDKRAFYLALTESGKALYFKQLNQTEQSLKREVSRFSEAEISRLNQAILQFLPTYTGQNQVDIVQGDLFEVGFIADLHSRVYARLGYKPILQSYVLNGLADFVAGGGQGKIWVTKINGTKVGTVSLIQRASGQWQLRWFALDSDYQGLGLGKKLMETLMAFVAEQGIEAVELWTVDELTAARSLYAKFGFHCVESVSNREWKETEINEERWLWESAV